MPSSERIASATMESTEDVLLVEECRACRETDGCCSAEGADILVVRPDMEVRPKPTDELARSSERSSIARAFDFDATGEAVLRLGLGGVVY